MPRLKWPPMEYMKFATVAIVVTCLKFLFMPCYRSTDFDVHRNWLSITGGLPLSRWYLDETSEWTLDYPPLFAWFEYALATIGRLMGVDDSIFRISRYPIQTWSAIIFQRATVSASDAVYVVAGVSWCEFLVSRSFASSSHLGRLKDEFFNPSCMIAFLFLWHPALLIVDHIHFQYNGFLSGFLLMSLVRMCQERFIESAIYFAILLNLKHIYLYMAPAFFVFLLRNYCISKDGRIELRNFVLLSVSVASIFAVSFAPFVISGQLGQVLARLFPFKRGLTHAYWAPNFWALYNAADKTLALLTNSRHGSGAMSAGLVQQYDHAFLFSVTPSVTVLITVISLIPAMYALWTRGGSPARSILFLRAVTVCSLASFMFGWHVHEKAILLPLAPMLPLAFTSRRDASLFSFLTCVGTWSLFPLLFEPAEALIKILLLALYAFYCVVCFTRLHDDSTAESVDRRKGKKGKEETSWWSFRWKTPILFSSYESLYLCGLIPLQVYYSVGHGAVLGSRMPFLPLMLTSVYSAAGVSYVFLCSYKRLLSSR